MIAYLYVCCDFSGARQASEGKVKFMITYILQYEIPLQVKIFNLGHDLFFWVMT